MLLAWFVYFNINFFFFFFFALWLFPALYFAGGSHAPQFAHKFFVVALISLYLITC